MRLSCLVFIVSILVIKSTLAAEVVRKKVYPHLFSVACDNNRLILKSGYFSLDADYLFDSDTDCLKQLANAKLKQEQNSKIDITTDYLEENMRIQKTLEWWWKEKYMCKSHHIGRVCKEDYATENFILETTIIFHDFFVDEVSIFYTRNIKRKVDNKSKCETVSCSCGEGSCYVTAPSDYNSYPDEAERDYKW